MGMARHRGTQARVGSKSERKRLDSLIVEFRITGAGSSAPSGPDYLGFSVLRRLRAADAELELITTLTYFGTAVDVAVAELRLEAFLPADEATAKALANLVAAAS
jgi:hypothetical protein